MTGEPWGLLSKGIINNSHCSCSDTGVCLSQGILLPVDILIVVVVVVVCVRACVSLQMLSDHNTAILLANKLHDHESAKMFKHTLSEFSLVASEVTDILMVVVVLLAEQHQVM